MGPENKSSVRGALSLQPSRRPYTPSTRSSGIPGSEVDMFACFAAVSVIDRLLLWSGGELTSWIFGSARR